MNLTRSLILGLLGLSLVSVFQNCGPINSHNTHLEHNGMGYDGRPEGSGPIPPISLKAMDTLYCDNEAENVPRIFYGRLVYDKAKYFIYELELQEVAEKGYFDPRDKTVTLGHFDGFKLVKPMPFFGHPLIRAELDASQTKLYIELGANAVYAARSYTLDCIGVEKDEVEE